MKHLLRAAAAALPRSTCRRYDYPRLQATSGTNLGQIEGQIQSDNPCSSVRRQQGVAAVSTRDLRAERRNPAFRDLRQPRPGNRIAVAADPPELPLRAAEPSRT